MKTEIVKPSILQRFFLPFVCLLSISSANILQESIDNAPAGSTLTLSAGIYPGKITIDKPLSIIGKEDGVIIKGDGRGRVFTINSSDVILKNLTITGSGSRMENLDAAIAMERVKRCEISGCRLLESLYGIDMKMVSDSVVSDNYITSQKNNIDHRGDALKIWYGNNNLIRNNTIDSSRDITLTYSHNNRIINNHVTDSRYGVHISMSHSNTVQGNTYRYNAVGVMVMGAKETAITNNIIESSKGAAGIGVVMKGVSNLRLHNNKISFNAKGLYIETKYSEEQMQRYITHNEISYNSEAIHFHAAIQNNTITNNKFFGNIDDAVKDSRKNATSSNIIEHNYWDRYAGFDANRDNIGDTPHQILQYSDRLWQYNNKVKFFYASPVLSLLDFLASIAPFIEPVLIIEDTKPIVKYPLP
ncbi:MAG: nitrous oxide reductase family maturation protein NosD [Campylobacterota bacterium]|nr:nitrous oxide reductase family maturation protein NosD [Campylobacterota bacterium]